ncbi:BA5345 family protein [Kurthia gibsonii]|uniref:hypothetical protein n=1 Tax=Kurthia gibsonii TaxID=33946 RepID=UPI002DB837CB|nr:hypothetical protein [Kurthia gibsonii]MEB7771436.1 hypothetical protein [Kurthia gibsonii]
MNFDTKYLIRWAIPGWVFLILMIFYFSIMNEGLLIENLKGTLILGLSASIALLGIPLGYLLNQLHHFLFWVCNPGNWVKYFEEEFEVDKLLTEESNKELRERYRYLLAKKHEVGSVFMSFLIAFILVVIFNSSLFQWDKLSTIYCLINLGAVCIWFFLRKYSSGNIDYHYKQLVLMTKINKEIEIPKEVCFKEDFKKAVYSEDKELDNFLNNKFCVSKNDTSLSDVEKNIDSLKDLSELEKKVAKARLKQFEEDNDVSKFFPVLIAIIAALLLSIDIISGWVIDTTKIEETNKKEEVAAEETGTEEGSSSNSKILSKIQNPLFLLSIAVILAIGLIIWYTIKLKRIYSHRSIAIYINSLLEDTLTNKKQELESEVSNNESKKLNY